MLFCLSSTISFCRPMVCRKISYCRLGEWLRCFPSSFLRGWRMRLSSLRPNRQATNAPHILHASLDVCGLFRETSRESGYQRKWKYPWSQLFHFRLRVGQAIRTTDIVHDALTSNGNWRGLNPQLPCEPQGHFFRTEMKHFHLLIIFWENGISIVYYSGSIQQNSSEGFLSNWELVKFRMLGFSERMGTGNSILTKKTGWKIKRIDRTTSINEVFTGICSQKQPL